ncbi:2-amino-4-hydroxy-6-hydroxymethyldihydropteridine diphosphokinase [Prauserella marina]|uniref:2-amino-4-hydroxy-6-hydroxymethyldihydropteridine diphosphokinase n=1 Tax=Prauserella marina TaxID=530584 RepID=A0A222VWL3_9PSEU|nr:2-amino-4-hydroxy-6-hydroxymethyldihydropteridine diphosphokinase [Prauserella marina]ASR38366.1 2-amino-4-hydroxy-6-hydroxymethyldihydropteridine diphosphokinase [Prauserella marina]PWV78417.1 2-amino-4-hydroxy-6-hydroxymethyldihydropteridine diphosphokinase [Prauserella marina]SDC85510.1 2-amino-4-hydroxy-6-hydroxymethyldihydropteridinediphosphokinase [Prauserella marina]
MSRAVLSLGSNLGDRFGYLKLAVEGLADGLVAVSSVYQTKPWGVLDQPDFLNAVCIVDDEDTDHVAWLRMAQRLEREAERTREQRWGPRTLDVDVVTVDDVRSTDPELLLPHPGTADRATVLIPWLEIDPGATVPGLGSAAELLTALPEADKAAVTLRADLTW